MRDFGNIFELPIEKKKENIPHERPTVKPPSTEANDPLTPALSETDAVGTEVPLDQMISPPAAAREPSDAAIVIDEPEFIDDHEIEELDPEIATAIDRISAVEGDPPDPEIEGIVIGERSAPYIPDAMFEAAGGTPASASLAEKEISSPSLNERRRLIVESISDALHITFSPRIERVHIAILEAAEAMFIHGQWIADDELLRKTLLLILTTIDPVHYSPADPLVMKRKSATLTRALISELRKRGKSKLASQLEQSREHPSGHFKPPTK